MIGAIIAGAGAIANVMEGQANREQQAQMQNAQMQMEENRMAMQMDAMRTNDIYRNQEWMRQLENDGMIRDQNDMMMSLTMQDRATFDRMQSLLRDQYYQDRQFVTDRQSSLDRAAAEQRAFDMEQLLRNEDLSEEQRDWAMAEYEEAKSIASGEREFDQAQLAKNQTQALQEYSDRVARINEMRDQLGSERQWQLDQYGNVVDATDNYSAQLQEMIDGFGNLVTAKRYGEGDVKQEASRLAGVYQGNVDRAVDRIASVNEADLMRDGIDRSTTGTARRGELAERVAPMYDQAYQKAYQDAMGHIQGLAQIEAGGANQALSERSALLSELGMLKDPIAMAMQSANMVNASGVNPAMIDAGSGVYNQNVGSAMGAFNMANMVGSGIYEGNVGNSMYGGMLNLPVASQGFQGPSGLMPQFQQLSGVNPMGYQSMNMGMVNNYGQGMSQAYGNMAQQYGDAAQSAYSSAAAGIGDFMGSESGQAFQQSANDWLKGLFSSGGTT